jgi:multiple sugar transport system permease protein
MVFLVNEKIVSGRKYYFKDRYWLYVFLGPSIIALLLLTVFPLVYSFRNTFYGWDLIKPNSQNFFVGLKNYHDVITSAAFLKSLRVTVIYSFWAVGGTVVFGTILAFVMFRNLPGNLIARTLCIAAMVISPVIIGTSFKLMLNPSWGLISWLLSLAGIVNPGYLAKGSTVLPAIILIDIWQWSPLVMVIVLASLQSIPVDIYDSSKIDGANSFQTFIYITVPHLKPSLMLAVLIRTMDSLRTFDLIFSMTQGGPGTASQNINLLMYNTGFEFFQISKVSTMAIILMILITIFASIIIKAFGGRELYK